MTQKQKHIEVTVTESPDVIDLAAWTRQYAAAILEAEGYPVTSHTEAA